MPPLIDETGNQYGRLRVLKRAENLGRLVAWLCKCQCGQTTIVRAGHLQSGHTTSCGCFSRERTSARNKIHKTTHGLRYTPEWAARTAMIQRCTNSKVANFHLYGGRGITVCKRWLAGCKAFYEDMGPRPSNEYSLDRIDNDGDYTPENCRWATKKEQAHNRRMNRNLTFRGKTQCIAAWAEELTMNYYTLWSRLDDNWSVERALTEPVRIR